MTGIDQGDGYDVHGEPVRARRSKPPTTRCPIEGEHPAHTWNLLTGGVESRRYCEGKGEPVPDVPAVPFGPTRAVANALYAQVGDVLTWGNYQNVNAVYRWDGENWQPLQVGDVCRNARDGSAVIWGGPVAGWRKPAVSRAQADELAAVIDPEYPSYGDDQSKVDHIYHLAERILAHGYVHTLRAPAVQPAAYHFPHVPYSVGDPVDVTWTNGRTTRHVIEAISPEGSLTMRNRE